MMLCKKQRNDVISSSWLQNIMCAPCIPIEMTLLVQALCGCQFYVPRHVPVCQVVMRAGTASAVLLTVEMAVLAACVTT